MRLRFLLSPWGALATVRIFVVLLVSRAAVGGAPDTPAPTPRPAPTNGSAAMVWTLAPPATVTAEHRLSWNLQTTAGDYRSLGHTNATWDAEVEEGLTAFARVRSGDTSTNLLPNMYRVLNSAREKGCRDPLVTYVLVRLRHPHPQNASAESLAAHREAATALSASRYHPIRRYYASLRVISEMRALPVFDNEEGLKSEAERDDWEEQAIKSLRTALLDTSLPLFDATESIQQLRYTNPRPMRRKQLYPILTEALRGRWPDQVSALALVGTLENELAWAYRGSGSALSVSEGGWVAFEMYLARAATALERAWALGPTNFDIPTQMMAVTLSDSNRTGEHETWFRRAMALDPNSEDACGRKLQFLQPKWHGSDEEMLAFGRECVASTHWGGRVPLVLVDAHNLVAGPANPRQPYAYWRKPGVWKDIEASFEKFFRLNPTQTGWYHNYALHAFRCGQYARFNELLPKLGPINHEYFGGQDKFEDMVRTAKREVEK